MIPLSHALILVGLLFIIGLTGVIIRRNLFFILLGLEIMINATAFAFVVVSTYLNQVDGHIMYILVITLSAIKASICLTVVLRLYRHYQILDVDKISEMYG
ncbi:NADH-quinone oxidoreductase subunit NuoK [Blochmannia endosymbiont of Camponotus (Colobopsis) obliquus]|uniref:NADH-quinone oxidoreductase subunit NuoK n=1 Tax=Blochmannia endosymbiont of Camponotus (Colobopsis) obliquus TaxID=1505597 RepID=UPI00061A8414|nr:NADH-quinone oxidoreductase subunit NuoK [Blochmannia endosymbiont of Camponotus (Colobopsis) obliquus]AKC60636.1 NADH-quinone oxidoreductase subunit K [Blochmannia endosymbiont of Camponotus (Colobopsis) obliquus]